MPVVEPSTTERVIPGSFLGEKEILVEHNSSTLFVLFTLEPDYLYLLSFHSLIKQSQQLNQLGFHRHHVGISTWLGESWCYGGIL